MAKLIPRTHAEIKEAVPYIAGETLGQYLCRLLPFISSGSPKEAKRAVDITIEELREYCK